MGMYVPQWRCQSLVDLLPAFILTLTIAFLPSTGRAAPAEELVCSPVTLGFGTVILGQSETELVSLVNTGETAVTVTSATADGSMFKVSGISLPAIVPAGGYVTLKVEFSPDTPGWVPGRITFVSDASNRYLNLPLAGAGVKAEPLTASPPSLSFGGVALHSSTTLPLTLTNQSSSKITVSALDMIGSTFSVTGASFPATLLHGQSIHVNVTFTPQTQGLVGGSILVGGHSFKIPLSGTGTGTTVGQLAITPGALTFGDVTIGSQAAQSAAVTATGGNVTIASASLSNSQFSISAISLPMTLPAGQSADFKVVFSPTKTGGASAVLTLRGDTASLAANESLSGTGAAAAQYSVTLSWNPSTSSVAGYNVYRGTAVGVYSKLNSSMDATTSYTDGTVASGTTYYYAATAINSKGQESTYSSPLKVSVP